MTFLQYFYASSGDWYCRLRGSYIMHQSASQNTDWCANFAGRTQLHIDLSADYMHASSKVVIKKDVQNMRFDSAVIWTNLQQKRFIILAYRQTINTVHIHNYVRCCLTVVASLEFAQSNGQ